MATSIARTRLVAIATVLTYGSSILSGQQLVRNKTTIGDKANACRSPIQVAEYRPEDFAGEHTSPWPTWMQGALHSGIRAANEVNDAV
jgi:hypothetical protein